MNIHAYPMAVIRFTWQIRRDGERSPRPGVYRARDTAKRCTGPVDREVDV